MSMATAILFSFYIFLYTAWR